MNDRFLEMATEQLLLQELDSKGFGPFFSPKSIQPIHYLMFASLMICLRIGGLDH